MTKQELREYIWNMNVDEGLGGGIKSTLASPFKLAGTAVKTVGKTVAAPFKVAGSAVGTAARTAGNVLTLRPKKAITTLGKGIGTIGKQAASPVTTAVRGTTKTVGDIGRGLAR